MNAQCKAFSSLPDPSPAGVAPWIETLVDFLFTQQSQPSVLTVPHKALLSPGNWLPLQSLTLLLLCVHIACRSKLLSLVGLWHCPLSCGHQKNIGRDAHQTQGELTQWALAATYCFVPRFSVAFFASRIPHLCSHWTCACLWFHAVTCTFQLVN